MLVWCTGLDARGLKEGSLRPAVKEYWRISKKWNFKFQKENWRFSKKNQISKGNLKIFKKQRNFKFQKEIWRISKKNSR